MGLARAPSRAIPGQLIVQSLPGTLPRKNPDAHESRYVSLSAPETVKAASLVAAANIVGIFLYGLIPISWRCAKKPTASYVRLKSSRKGMVTYAVHQE